MTAKRDKQDEPKKDKRPKLKKEKLKDLDAKQGAENVKAGGIRQPGPLSEDNCSL